MSTAPKTIIVVPCYNEEKRLPVDDFGAFLRLPGPVGVCFVNDDSSDDTLGVINRIAQEFPDKAQVLNLKHNGGKGEAVRQGILYLKEENPDMQYFGYFDADLAAPLDQVRHLFAQLPQDKFPAFVCGSRVKLLGSTKIDRLWYRHYFGRVFATVVSLMLKLAVYDTQCGAKLIRTDVVNDLFDEPFTSRWLFDVELFFRCIRKFGYSKVTDEVYELPLSSWVEKGDSKIGFGYVFKVPFELIHIGKRYRKQVHK